MNLLDDFPLATFLAIAAVVLSTIAYINGDISFFEALSASGIGTAGAGVLGHARNGAGRGVK